MNKPKITKPHRSFESGEVDAAHRIYLKHGPDNLYSIVRELNCLGFKKFTENDMRGHGSFAGLETMHGWFEEWVEKRSSTSETTAQEDEAPRKTEIGFREWLIATEKRLTWTFRYQRPIYKALGEVTAARRDRLMLFLPPRHGKSELVTIRYAAWRLLHDARLRLVIASYNQRLANRFSRRIRSIYTGTPFTLEADEMKPPDLVLSSADEWETRDGGGVKAVGVGAGITGFGADLIIIDDPVKSRAEVESKNLRDRVWEWFTDDLMTRLESNGSVILIQTRWHEDDLAGRLLGQVRTGSSSDRVPDRNYQWNLVSRRAIAVDDDRLKRKPGEALCPKRYPLKKLLEKKEEMGSYSFAALYQQTPMPAGGGLFKRESFSRIVQAAPPGLRWFRGYDLAVSTKTSADYTASFRVALDKRTGDLYIADGFRARLEFPDQRKYIIGRIRDELDTEHGIEEALHGQAFVQELWRDGRLGRSAFRGVRVTADKFTRALAWANRAEAGHIVLVRGPWIDAFLDEITHFPNGAHDDQVDAVSLAVQMMETRKYRAMGF